MSPVKFDQNYFFIHNIFAHFFDDTLRYFSDYLYPRFHHRVIGTYDKAVEYINKKIEYGNEHDMPNLPAIVLNPSGEFHISDAISGAHQLWRFPNISNGMETLKMRLYDPIYQDSNLAIHPIFVRLKGEFELILLLNSFYEYCDMKLYLYQIFGGENRPIYPSTFRTFLIIPDEMLNFEYYNAVDGTRYTLDWDSAGAFETLVKTTNKNEIVVPVNITPRYTLTGMSDASMKYGGADKLADWRLNVNVEYEIELPWYVFLKTDYLIDKVNFNFIVYSYMGDVNNVMKDVKSYDEFLNLFDWDSNLYRKTISYDWGMIDGQHNTKPDDEIVAMSKNCEESEWEKTDFYFYQLTQSDIDNINNNNPSNPIIINYNIDNVDMVVHVMSKYGQLVINLDYVLDNSNSSETRINIIKNVEDDDIIWEVDDIIELYVFNKK